MIGEQEQHRGTRDQGTARDDAERVQWSPEPRRACDGGAYGESRARDFEVALLTRAELSAVGASHGYSRRGAAG